jgi:hypothetical protein
MPNRSPSILAAIDDAEQNFQKAAATLPSLSRITEALGDQLIPEIDEMSVSTGRSPASSNRSSLNHRTRCSSISSAPSTTATCVSDADPENMFNLHTFEFPTSTQQSRELLTDENTDPTSPPLSPLYKFAFSDPTANRYNAHMTSLHLTISTHLDSLATFRSSVLRARNREARFGPSSSVKKEMTAEEKRERILKGRERGWKMTRFDRSRYEVLVERALGELGG